ncbi:DeoR/GlpR family DNA-binding transcription regulator [Occultella kanbiaonis]|uniref:DeoR/GlpR family DNA-binding transcription regulator n=2 Tax=Occultella kanbiaonis TaxID=2675754 RepID=UPI0012B98503|nr:DeoR/GlpR family DNA-binding transcription regulator [Occultella kanbiaonis]
MSDSASAAPEVAGRASAVQRRRTELLALVRREGRLDVGPTAARLGVTQETLRRDLLAMERSGLVRRTYGAAFPVESGRLEAKYEVRKSRNVEEKRRIADAAAALVGPAQTVYIDDGYLPSLVAQRLTSERPVTVVTSSLPTAMAVAERPGVEVLLVGGRVRGSAFSTVEHGRDSLLERLRIDVAFMSAGGISPERGLTTTDPAVAAVKTAAMAASARRIFIGTHAKFGMTAFVRFADVHEFEALVTGTEVPAHRTARYARLGPRVIRA